MKANCWFGKQDLRVEEVPEPRILNEQDAIIKVTLTAICGSDLHLYGGFMPTMEKGDILGHEFMGEGVETGRNGKKLKKGGRVGGPVPIAWWCRFRLRAERASRASGRCIRSARTPIRMQGLRRRCWGIRSRECLGI